MLKIALLDSGVLSMHSEFEGIEIGEIINFLDKEANEIIDSHGTNVCNCITNALRYFKISNEVHIYNLKIFNDRSCIKEDIICTALEYCIELGVSIVNLSIGITGNIIPPSKLYKICNKLYENNIILVSAADNLGGICYPADFGFSIGVSAGYILDSEAYTYFYDLNRKHFVAKGQSQKLAGLNFEYEYHSGTSCATGTLTGLLASYIIKNNLQGNEISETIQQFKNNSQLGYCKIINQQSQKKLQPLGLFVREQTYVSSIIDKFFGCNKLSWIRSISFYYNDYEDIDCLNEFINITESTLIRSCNNHENYQFCTAVIQSPNNAELMDNPQKYCKLLRSLIIENKNILCLDFNVYKDVKSLCDKNNIQHIYFPCVTNNTVRELKSLTSLGPIQTPVIALIGIDDEKKLFKNILVIKKFLESTGYNVGWLSTDTRGELYGAKLTFPYHIHRGVEAAFEDWKLLLHGMLKGIEFSSTPDIIMTETVIQKAKLMARGFNMTDEIASFAFLSSIAPDAIILSVNSNSLGTIKKYINFYKLAYGVTIIAIIVNIDYNSKDKEAEISSDTLTFMNKVGDCSESDIPIFLVYENDVTQLKNVINCIETFFDQNNSKTN